MACNTLPYKIAALREAHLLRDFRHTGAHSVLIRPGAIIDPIRPRIGVPGQPLDFVVRIVTGKSLLARTNPIDVNGLDRYHTELPG